MALNPIDSQALILSPKPGYQLNTNEKDLIGFPNMLTSPSTLSATLSLIQRFNTVLSRMNQQPGQSRQGYENCLSLIYIPMPKHLRQDFHRIAAPAFDPTSALPFKLATNAEHKPKGLFSRLTPKIRRKIWRLTLKERVLAYDCCETSPKSPYCKMRLHKSKLGFFGRSIKSQPTILSICRESRRVAVSAGIMGLCGYDNLWWFPETDLIYFNGLDRFEDFKLEASLNTRGSIRQIAVLGHDRCSWQMSDWRWYSPLVASLPCLIQIHVFVPGPSLDLIQTRSEAPFREPGWAFGWPTELKPLDPKEVLGDERVSPPSNPWVQLTSWEQIREWIYRYLRDSHKRHIMVRGREYNRIRPKTRARKRRKVEDVKVEEGNELRDFGVHKRCRI